MKNVPNFKLYGEGDGDVESSIQPILDLRNWTELNLEEKKIIFRQIENAGWITSSSNNLVLTIDYLNNNFLRLCPGVNLHKVKSAPSYHREMKMQTEAYKDFQAILFSGSEPIVLRMISKIAHLLIDRTYLSWAVDAKNEKDTEENIRKAFYKFDLYARDINHIFEQFSINVMLTRNGLIPKQDVKITDSIYIPTLRVLSDPKWKSVSEHLTQMFTDYHDGDYSEVITKAHSAIQRFLQILVGEEGKNGKGELKQLFAEAKKQDYLSKDRFTEAIIDVLQGFLASERATKGTAKPSLVKATSADALLVINVVMVLIQHCLQNLK